MTTAPTDPTTWASQIDEPVLSPQQRDWLHNLDDDEFDVFCERNKHLDNKQFVHAVSHAMRAQGIQINGIDALDELEDVTGTHVTPGGDSILDEPDEVPAVWGDDSEVLWAEGEPCMIVAPPGVGKTTLAQQVVLGLIGLRTEVLDRTVHGNRRVLYLAMDRPRQIRRSFRRMVVEADRQTLNDRLAIRSGPPPADLAAHPSVLAELAAANNADVIVIDSLKDAAVKLTDDETGGLINRALQHAIAGGVEVLVLHHQRKGQNGAKPNTLEDVYGSTWITAGMGSVLLLWGTAGDPIVELRHLKQPADAVGPWKLEHNHHAGTTTIHRGFELRRYLTNRGDAGATASEVAVAMLEKARPTEADKKRAKRKLDDAVRRGWAEVDTASVGGDGGTKPARYRLKATS